MRTPRLRRQSCLPLQSAPCSSGHKRHPPTRPARRARTPGRGRSSCRKPRSCGCAPCAPPCPRSPCRRTSPSRLRRHHRRPHARHQASCACHRYRDRPWAAASRSTPRASGRPAPDTTALPPYTPAYPCREGPRTRRNRHTDGAPRPQWPATLAGACSCYPRS